MAKVKKKRKGSKVYKAVACELRETCKNLREVLKEKQVA